MIKISRKLTETEKELLLQLQNQRRSTYGLKPLKTLDLKNLINLQEINNTKTSTINHNDDDGGMYQ